MSVSFFEMTLEQKNSFNERYMALYAEMLDSDDPDEAARLKDELTQMELDAGLYGSL